MVTTKLIIWIVGAIVSLSGLGWVGYDYYSKIQENAVLEASVDGLTQSIVDANSQINDYAIQTTVLQQAFEYAALDESNFNQKVDSHDYEALARRKPDQLESVLNSSIAGMWDEVRDITGYQDPTTPATTKTDTREPSTSDSESD